MAKVERLRRVSTGITGYDEILNEGFIANRSYLIRGGPGVGKTILGLHFLAAGVAAGETCLFISLGEPEAELRTNAEQLGFDLTKYPLPRPQSHLGVFHQGANL